MIGVKLILCHPLTLDYSRPSTGDFSQLYITRKYCVDLLICVLLLLC